MNYLKALTNNVLTVVSCIVCYVNILFTCTNIQTFKKRIRNIRFRLLKWSVEGRYTVSPTVLMDLTVSFTAFSSLSEVFLSVVIRTHRQFYQCHDSICITMSAFVDFATLLSVFLRHDCKNDSCLWMDLRRLTKSRKYGLIELVH